MTFRLLSEFFLQYVNFHWLSSIFCGVAFLKSNILLFFKNFNLINHVLEKAAKKFFFF